MVAQLIDLTKIDFWIISIAGLIFLTPVLNPGVRKCVWAALNLGFIALILKLDIVYVLLGIAIIYFFLKGIGSSSRFFFIVPGGIALTGLFVFHKMPQLTANLAYVHTDKVSSMLSVIGFSYIALRLVEIMRAVFERRYPAPGLISIVNYLVPFNMLAAGPIQSYDEFAKQAPVPEKLNTRDTLEAVERIVRGLFKKFVLAYGIQKAFLTDFESEGYYFFFEVQIFFIWLYLDFSAYSDIAVGIGRLLGVATPENFNRPYLARNMIDFWDRWHISLSQFIRRNIFIPLQLFLARRTDGRHMLLSASLAFTVSFVLCGLWHGISINFLLWGGIHAIGLVIANLYREYLKRTLEPSRLKAYHASKPIRWVARVITFEYVAFSLVALFYPQGNGYFS